MAKLFKLDCEAKKLSFKPDGAMRSRPVEVFQRYKSTCPSNILFVLVTLSVTLNSEADTRDVCMCMWTYRDTHTHSRKMRSRERRSLKFQGDAGEERWASSGSSDLPGNRLHQYENEPAVTLAAVRLPWHFSCLEDMPLQGRERQWACVSNSMEGLQTGLINMTCHLLLGLRNLSHSQILWSFIETSFKTWNHLAWVRPDAKQNLSHIYNLEDFFE